MFYVVQFLHAEDSTLEKIDTSLELAIPTEPPHSLHHLFYYNAK